jgi:hypothetical protein
LPRRAPWTKHRRQSRPGSVGPARHAPLPRYAGASRRSRSCTPSSANGSSPSSPPPASAAPPAGGCPGWSGSAATPSDRPSGSTGSRRVPTGGSSTGPRSCARPRPRPAEATALTSLAERFGRVRRCDGVEGLPNQCVPS